MIMCSSTVIPTPVSSKVTFAIILIDNAANILEAFMILFYAIYFDLGKKSVFL